MSTQPFKTIILDLLRQGRLDAETVWQSLSETERSAVGTPEIWSAKDHLSHRTFWHRDLVRKLTAFLHHQEIPQTEEDEQLLNTQNFEAHKQESWSEVYAESERVFTELLSLVEQLSEEDLTTPNPISNGRPLYAAFLGGCYEHDQEHLAQYYQDRLDIQRAVEIREQCASRIISSALPDWAKGSFLYNLACFYAKLNPQRKAISLLQEALTLAPNLKEWSLKDPDLATIRDQLA